MGIERSIGLAIIKTFAPTGMAANAIIRLAKAQGGGYRKTDMLEDIRTEGQRFKNQFWVEKLQSNEVVSQGLMVEKQLGYDAKYRVYGTYTYYSEETDDYLEETKSFYTDDLKSKGDMVDEYRNKFKDTGSGKPDEYIAFNVTGIEHNFDYEY